MIPLRLSALVVLLANAAGGADAQGTLVVEVSGFHSDRGQLLLRLYDPRGAAGFPVDGDKALRQHRQRIEGSRAIVRLEGVPFGALAIACVHDENGNGKLDTGLFGIPKEGVGASNGARGHRGPPEWKDARFDFRGDGQVVRVGIIY
jgi:uncharacterized protein (DUF2141 family)